MDFDFDLDLFLPYRLSQLANTVSREVGKVYEGEHGLSRTQWRIMAVLASGSQTAQFIASKTVMNKSVISRAVKDMIAAGIIARTASQTDGRSAPLMLTPKGEGLFAALLPAALEVESHIKTRLTKDERKALLTICEKLT